MIAKATVDAKLKDMEESEVPEEGTNRLTKSIMISVAPSRLNNEIDDIVRSGEADSMGDSGLLNRREDGDGSAKRRSITSCLNTVSTLQIGH